MALWGESPKSGLRVILSLFGNSVRRTKMDAKKGRKSESVLKRVDMTTIIILFFLAVVMTYYTMLQSEMKQKIIVTRELVATKSANQINEYLSTGVDIIRGVSYTLDDMIRKGKSPEEMEAFLENQYAASEHITAGNSTGLYAVVSDVFIDGTGWVPPEDYVPQERPWYGGAMANIGQVAVVDPYLDAKTHTMMITLSKSLCDVKSVASMDFSLSYLQKMTEELAAKGDSDIEIVIDRNYQVIAHSDRAEVGKNYLTEEGTFGKMLVDELRSTNEKYFSFRFGDEEYIVYKVPVANSWLCLSVFDATSTFTQLRRTLLLTIVVLLLVISIILAIMTRYENKARLAQELNQKAETAAAANEAKSTFLSNMSHEIRTPINAVLGMNEMILRESREPNVIEYAENIHTAGNTLLGLINDILDFSKIEAGKMEIIPVDYDLSSVFNDLVNMIHTRADAKGLELLLDFDKEMPKHLYGDEVRFKQVITNILTNAVKYTETGSVTLTMAKASVHEGQESPSGQLGGASSKESVTLAISVRDTGIGIQKEDMGRLFESFERLDEQRNRNIEGTGLGMSIVTKLLAMMGSELTVDSVYGEGSVFSFRLRQEVMDPTSIGDFSKRLMRDSGERGNEVFLYAPLAKVLVVDDNDMNLKVMKGLLKRNGIVPELASSGADAVEMMRQKPPGLT